MSELANEFEEQVHRLSVSSTALKQHIANLENIVQETCKKNCDIEAKLQNINCRIDTIHHIRYERDNEHVRRLSSIARIIAAPEACLE